MRAVATLLLLGLAAAGCRPTSDEDPAALEEGPPVAALPSSRAFAGPAACADCHPDAVRAHAGSAHALTVSELDEGAALPASFGPEAKVATEAESLGRPQSPTTVLAVDAEGIEAPRAASHVLGVRRRLDFLHPFRGELHVLPLSWSVTQEEWVGGAAEEGRPAEPGRWTGTSGAWRPRCAGCHPMPGAGAGASVPMSPEESRGLRPGISCEHCHGPGALHAALAASAAPAAERDAAILRAGPDAWQGCAHCHARGEELPLTGPEALRPGDAIETGRLFETAVGVLGPNRRFFADGRPGDAHGRSALSLEQSRCFRVGRATCVSCHDPHSGGLRETDPDAACRGCHEAEAADPEAHARHPVASAPVPLSRLEPTGPDPARAPGCVDCHAPAVLSLGSKDRVRDHAFTRPEPELTRDFGVPEACTACHAESAAEEHVAWLDEHFPGRATRRFELAVDLRAVIHAAATGEVDERAAEAIPRLEALIEDPERGEGLRASAAHALGALGRAGRAAAPTLVAAARGGSPLVAQAALAALGHTGGADPVELVRLARGGVDWRVRLAAAGALDRLGRPEGAAELEVLAEDGLLPAAATAQARLQLGLALLKRGARRRAAFQLEEAARIEPELVAAWLNLGVARIGLGEVEGARLAWLTALDLEPGNVAARVNLQRLEEP